MISILILILMSTQVRPYCEDITTDGTYTELGIYRHFDINDTESVRLYNREGVEIEVEVSSNLSLKFKKRLQLNRTAHYKFSIYLADEEREGFVNCEVFPDEELFSTNCRSERFSYEGFYLKYPNQSVIVKPFEGVLRWVLVFDRYNKKHYFSNGVNRISVCYKQYNVTERCKMPLFLQEMDDILFSKMEGVVDLKLDGKNGYLILFAIDGRHKYCVTYEESLSEECKSSVNMKTLFKECFDYSVTLLETSESQTTFTQLIRGLAKNPKFWILIVGLIISAIFCFVSSEHLDHYFSN